MTTPKTQTFVDNAGRPVNPDEVREVKPIDLQTPQQLLEKARKELAQEREKVVALEAKVADAVADAKKAVELADFFSKENEFRRKRIAEIAAEREVWRRRAETAEAQPKPEHIANIVADRDRLRGEVAEKDRQIANLDKMLATTNTAIQGSQKMQQQAEQRAAHMEGTLESMQVARDAAQAREAEAKRNHEGACKTIAEMHAAAVGKVEGPKRGLVEDVLAVREERDALKIQVSNLLAKVATPAPVKARA